MDGNAAAIGHLLLKCFRRSSHPSSGMRCARSSGRPSRSATGATFETSGGPRRAAQDPAAVERCYREVEVLMLARLDRLTLERTPFVG